MRLGVVTQDVYFDRVLRRGAERAVRTSGGRRWRGAKKAKNTENVNRVERREVPGGYIPCVRLM